jgi:DNA-binding transcriptional LysR family regulator
MAVAPEPRLLSAFSSLELRHLQALDAVATEGTFGRAAERLGYTQSAVSQQIAALERAIGGVVFDRPGGPKPVRITPLGKLVLGHARDLLDRAQATAEAIERFKAGEGRIDIGTFQSVSNVMLPQIVKQLRDEHPAVDLRVFEEDTAVDRLLAGELDLTFWVGPLDGPIESVKLLDDPYVLVSRRGDFPDGPVRCEQLDGVQMVSFPRLLCDMGRVEDSFAAAGVEPVIVFRTADNGAVTSMVRAGMGAAVMPMLAVDIHPDDDVLCTHELIPTIRPREVCVMWQAGRTLSPLARRVIDISVSVAAGVAAARAATRPRGRARVA